MDPLKHDISFEPGEETERLIVRHLDGEITVAEQARLDQILAASDEARALLADYREIDAMAAKAMRSELAGVGKSATAISHPRVIPIRSRLQPWLVGTAGAILSAAAVIALSLMLNNNPRGPSIAQQSRPSQPLPAGPLAPSELVDYRHVDYQPRQRFDNVYRDLIGIRGSNPNRIYVFERETQATKTVPVSGDF